LFVEGIEDARDYSLEFIVDFLKGFKKNEIVWFCKKINELSKFWVRNSIEI
jgi:hypothetical protein